MTASLPLVVALAGCALGNDESVRAASTKQRLLLRDDFSSAPDSDWYTGEFKRGAVRYVKGRYEVLVKREDWTESESVPLGEVARAMRVEIDAVQAAGDSSDDVGVFCYAHQAARQNAGYALRIGPGGWAGIDRELEGTHRRLKERGHVTVIRPVGSKNHLRADCIGATREQPALLVLYVNGQQVLRAEDVDGFPRFDGVGVTTGNEDGRNRVYYDNLVVNELL